MRDVIISIRPDFCKAIYSGKKPVELRKKIGKEMMIGSKIYIYTSRREKSITGEAIISNIERLQISTIKEKYLKSACISEHDFNRYYEECQHGFVISIRDVIQYKEQINLKLKFKEFKAPQSYMYASTEVGLYIEEIKCT